MRGDSLRLLHGDLGVRALEARLRIAAGDAVPLHQAGRRVAEGGEGQGVLEAERRDWSVEDSVCVCVCVERSRIQG